VALQHCLCCKMNDPASATLPKPKKAKKSVQFRVENEEDLDDKSFPRPTIRSVVAAPDHSATTPGTVRFGLLKQRCTYETHLDIDESEQEDIYVDIKQHQLDPCLTVEVVEGKLGLRVVRIVLHPVRPGEYHGEFDMVVHQTTRRKITVQATVMGLGKGTPLLRHHVTWYADIFFQFPPSAPCHMHALLRSLVMPLLAVLLSKIASVSMKMKRLKRTGRALEMWMTDHDCQNCKDARASELVLAAPRLELCQ
jgi:hypothetical protein